MVVALFVAFSSHPFIYLSIYLSLFVTKIKNERFKPVLETSCSPFDPKLSIDGKAIRFILDPEAQDKFKGSHFKFLGRWIHYNLSEEGIKKMVRQRLMDDIKTVDKSSINGFMKLWIYQFYVLARLSWPFLVHDFDLSFSKELEIARHVLSWTNFSLGNTTSECNLSNAVCWKTVLTIRFASCMISV